MSVRQFQPLSMARSEARDLALLLVDAEETLQGLIDAAKPMFEASTGRSDAARTRARATHAPTPLPRRAEPASSRDVLESAERLQFVVMPPADWTPDKPMTHFIPPNPPAEAMRRGLLAQDGASAEAPPPPPPAAAAAGPARPAAVADGSPARRGRPPAKKARAFDDLDDG